MQPITRRSFLKGALALIGAGLVTNMPAARALEAIAQAEPELAQEARALAVPEWEAEHQLVERVPDAVFEPYSVEVHCSRPCVYADIDSRGLECNHIFGPLEGTVRAIVEGDTRVVKAAFDRLEPICVEFKYRDIAYCITGFVTSLGEYVTEDARLYTRFAMEIISGALRIKGRQGTYI